MGKSYRIEFAPAAARQFRKLPRDAKRRLRPVIDALATDPRPQGSKKLAGEDDLYRVRAGDYRVVYAIEAAALLVLVVRVGLSPDGGAAR